MADEGAFRQAVLAHAEEGSARLAPLMTAAGFGAPAYEVVRGSGGPAAVATWRRADGMRVETHVRGTLGIVRYLWHDEALDHRDYLRVKGVRGAYPGFSAGPSEAFQDLLTDLQGPASALLSMSEEEFGAAVRSVRELAKPGLP